MLRLAHAATIVAVTAGLVAAAPSTASADEWGRTICPDGSQRPGCDVSTGTTGQTGSSTNRTGGRDGDRKCRKPGGDVIPCRRGNAWAGGDGCYYSPADLSADTVAALGGQPAGEGGWYNRTCYAGSAGGELGLGGPVWIAGAAPVLSPEVLARQARAKLLLPGVVIELSPSGDQLVRLPTWLSVAASSWHERSATAAVPGVSVTATARPVKATWVMGDGSAVVCEGPGTPWKPGADPAAASPDCGHRYLRSSARAPGAAYTVMVTVAWEVTWAGAGQSGTIAGLGTTGSVRVRVAESQALVTR